MDLSGKKVVCKLFTTFISIVEGFCSVNWTTFCSVNWSSTTVSVAQLVSALHRNRRAAGSIPARGPIVAFFAPG